MTEIRLKNLSKCFGSVQAVKQANWTVSSGEFVVLFGPSGAGKTTTLKMIAGLEKPDEGQLYFDDRSMEEVDPADRDVAMAFENYALYPHLNVFENIAFPLQVPGHRQNQAEVKRRVQEVAALLQIDMLLERRPTQLSGGQRQRVALGRCLVREPRVFLMDEPIAHLDAKLRHRMYAELKRIQRQRGTTTIYATPGQSEAMAMGDRIIVMREGGVLQIGTPRELYEQPANVAVANFGGEQVMNIIPAEVAVDGDRLEFLVAGQRVAAPDRLRGLIDHAAAPKSVLIGVRPVDIQCLTCPASNMAGAASNMAVVGTLYSVERLGRTNLVTARVGEQMVEVSTSEEMAMDIGAPVWLSFADGRIHLFDAGSTQRILSTAGGYGKQ